MCLICSVEKKQAVGLKGRLHSLYLKFHNQGIKFWPHRDITITITVEAAILFLKMSHMTLKTKQIIKFKSVQAVKTSGPGCLPLKTVAKPLFMALVDGLGPIQSHFSNCRFILFYPVN